MLAGARLGGIGCGQAVRAGAVRHRLAHVARRLRAPCRVLIAPLLLAALAAGCGGESPPSHPAPAQGQRQHAFRDRAELRRERERQRQQRLAAQRRRQERRRELAASGCPSPSRTLEGVYHPDRLRVIDPCRRISGTVDEVRDEEDGDIHILLSLDPAYRGMLMHNNYAIQHGDLVVEFMPRDYGHLPRPAPGDRLVLVGAYVDDTDHAWAELHPVFAVSINGGPPNRSGPQFGGDPPYASSSDAVALCRTNTGARCRGYNGELAPPASDEGGEGGGGGSAGSGCTPGYSPCIPPGPDVDCAGGGGDGPRFVQGPVRVSGSDPYGLDSDGDGVGCS